MNLIKVEIKKPVYGTFCYIRESIVENAIRLGFKLEVIIPQGKSIVDPVEWKKTGKVMKKVFKFPGNPLVLFGNYVELPNIPKGRIIEPEEEKQERLF